MARITGKSSGGKKTGSPVDKQCRECKKVVHNVDESASSVLCYRCVAKSLSPGTIFVDELSPEEFGKLLRKTRK